MMAMSKMISISLAPPARSPRECQRSLLGKSHTEGPCCFRQIELHQVLSRKCNSACLLLFFLLAVILLQTIHMVHVILSRTVGYKRSDKVRIGGPPLVIYVKAIHVVGLSPIFEPGARL